MTLKSMLQYPKIFGEGCHIPTFMSSQYLHNLLDPLSTVVLDVSLAIC